VTSVGPRRSRRGQHDPEDAPAPRLALHLDASAARGHHGPFVVEERHDRLADQRRVAPRRDRGAGFDGERLVLLLREHAEVLDRARRERVPGNVDG
jgi:hypothetical protein